MNVAIVGVGLIGGSMALALKENGIAKKVIGVGRSAISIAKAIDLGIIDEALPLEEAVKQSDFIYVSIPVDATIPVMLQIMDLITDKQIVVDAGSTKFALCDALKRSSDAKAICSNAPHVGYRI
jgi:prephenate dehydrogenase